MAVTSEEPRLRHASEAARVLQPASGDGRASGADALHRLCPYLEAGDGGWRSIVPTSEHRCGAIRPAVPLAAAKQRDLCLRPGHDGCATFLAARDLEAAASAVGGRPPGFWPPTRATVLALEPARGRVAALPTGVRTGGQAMLVGLMVLAFIVLVIARTTPPAGSDDPATILGAAVLASGSPVAAATASPRSSGPVSQPASSPTSMPDGSASPTAATPTPSPADATSRPTASPAALRSYTVKAGDTLSSIAATLGTTVRKIRKANGLTDNVIHPGQALVIP